MADGGPRQRRWRGPGDKRASESGSPMSKMRDTRRRGWKRARGERKAAFDRDSDGGGVGGKTAVVLAACIVSLRGELTPKRVSPSLSLSVVEFRPPAHVRQGFPHPTQLIPSLINPVSSQKTSLAAMHATVTVKLPDTLRVSI